LSLKEPRRVKSLSAEPKWNSLLEVEHRREVVGELYLVDRDDERMELSVGRRLHFDEAFPAVFLEGPYVVAVPHPISWTVDGANHAAFWSSSRCATAGVR
jgi:hypothetical protein